MKWMIMAVIIVMVMIFMIVMVIMIAVNIGRNRNWSQDDAEQMDAIAKMNVRKKEDEGIYR